MSFSIKNFKSFYNFTKPTKNSNIQKYSINVKTKKDYYNDDILKSISFEKPISIIDALKSFINNPEIINDFWRLKDYSPKRDINRLINEIQESEHLKNKKTTSMLGCGYSSYVFDIGNDKVIKFTCGDHFNGRKPEFFDLPIQESGKITESGNHYYYIEEKVSQDNITDYDIKMMEAQAGILDYLLFDCHSFRQFGRTKDGHIRLIDPECAEKNPNQWYKINKRVTNWLYKKMEPILSW